MVWKSVDQIISRFSLNVFYWGRKYTEKDWVRIKVRHYPLQVSNPLKMYLTLRTFLGPSNGCENGSGTAEEDSRGVREEATSTMPLTDLAMQLEDYTPTVHTQYNTKNNHDGDGRCG